MKSPKGWVYVLENPAMPGLVKVVGTGGSVGRRLKQLHTTGVPLPFRVAFKAKVTDWRAAEAAAHAAIAPHRRDSRREFFALPVDHATEQVACVCVTWAARADRSGEVPRPTRRSKREPGPGEQPPARPRRLAALLSADGRRGPRRDSRRIRRAFF